MGAGAIILNDNQHILLVKPTYCEKWLFPGGIVEAHESPGAACLREIKEELNLDVKLGRLLCVEYRSTASPKTESLQFIFYCGTLTNLQIEKIQLPSNELNAFSFVSISEATNRLEVHSQRRLQWAWKAIQEQRTIYAEDGIEHIS